MKAFDRLTAKKIKEYSDAMLKVKESAVKQLMKMGAALNELEFQTIRGTGRSYLVWNKKNIGFEFREEKLQDSMRYVAVPVYMEKPKEKTE